MQFAGPACRKSNQRSSRTPQASPLTCGDDCRRTDPTDGLYSRRCGFRVAREATLNLARVMIQAHMTTTLLPASRHRLRARSAPHHRQERKQWSTAEAPCATESLSGGGRTTGRVASGRTPASERARCGIIPGAGRGLSLPHGGRGTSGKLPPGLLTLQCSGCTLKRLSRVSCPPRLSLSGSLHGSG